MKFIQANWLVIAVTIAYAMQSGIYIHARRLPQALMLIGYAIANVGFLMTLL